MGRSQETFSKKENKKKKAQKKRDKAEKMAERKLNKTDGNSLDDMIAYVDEYGNITDTPPDPKVKRKEIELEDIQIGVPKMQEGDSDGGRTGIITNFNEAKGFGFIRDQQFGEDIFVHVSSLKEPVKQGDKVSFSTEKGPRGLVAIEVKKAI